MPRPLTALLVLLALAGCGGDDDDYSDQFPPIDRQLVRLGNDVETALRGAGQSDDAALAGRFESFAQRLGRVRDRLQELDAPPGLDRDHARLLAATAEVRAALARIAVAAKGPDTLAARDAATALVRGGSELEEARTGLARAVRN